jgi:undecaprenyl-diphosphatase
MESTLNAFILGIVQGLTEFLPVSSSGHLVIGQNLLGMKDPELLLDTVLHLGTLCATVVFLRPQIMEIITGLGKLAQAPGSFKTLYKNDPGIRWFVLMVIASIPTAIIGLSFEDFFESLFGNLFAVGISLLFTGFLLLATYAVLRRKDQTTHPITATNGFVMGLAQSIAIIPGISRSGITIATGLFSGLDVTQAARLSFLISIPAIVGAVILQFLKVDSISQGALVGLVIGFATAALSGYYALKLLFNLLEKRRFHLFGFYCLTIGAFTIIFSLTAGS